MYIIIPKPLNIWALNIFLKISQILTEILKQNSASLKTARLVSQFWNEMVLSLQNSRLFFDLTVRTGNDVFKFLDMISTIDHRLAKRICISADTPSSPLYSSKLNPVCAKFTNSVQILEISIHSETPLHSVLLALKNSCLNLTKLRLLCQFDSPDWESQIIWLSQIKVFGSENYEEFLQEELPQKPNLTLFSVRSNHVTQFVTNFTRQVINASPNLRELTLPWKVYPDLANSKCIKSLTIELQPGDVFQVNIDHSHFSRMMNQVCDQLVKLSFVDKGEMRSHNFRAPNPPGFQLPRNMSKLEVIRNEITDIFHCDDHFKDIGDLSNLRTLVFGTTNIWVDEILQNLFHTNKILAHVKNLGLIELHDPAVLEELAKTFPNLGRLQLETCREFCEHVCDNEFGDFLKSCGSFKRLNHLTLTHPIYPRKIVDFIKPFFELLQSCEGEWKNKGRNLDNFGIYF